MPRLIVLIAAAAAAAASAFTAQAAPEASGIAHAKDGDSLRVGDTEVRLFGIDAPELHQRCQRGGSTWACGEEAREQLASLANGRLVRCQNLGIDDYGRMLGRCFAGTIELNRIMVSLGYAVAFRHYSLEYASTEDAAKALKRGIWAGTFTMPEDYRHAAMPAQPTARAVRQSARQAPRRIGSVRAQSNCVIKGNRNRKGQWIYHLPGMPYYDQTRPEEIFCTEREAQAAGYRRALVR